MNTLKIALCALMLLIAAVTAMAQGTYTEIHVPGAILTESWGINARGDVVGTYEDTNAFYHGFLLSGGTYTTIDYSGGIQTFLLGLNNFGQIIGITRSEVAFVYDTATQAFTVLAYPGSRFTYPQGINDAGIVVGYIEYAQTATSGFEWKNSTYIPISPPGPHYNSYALAISASGIIAGQVRSVPGAANANFIFEHGKYRPITFANAPNAGVQGINPAGTELVGGYSGSTAQLGFTYENGQLTPLQFPGMPITDATGVNNNGTVVGFYFDTNSIEHGFIWTPPAGTPKP